METADRTAETAEAARLVALHLIEIFEAEGGELSPWAARRVRDRLIRYSLDLGREGIEAARGADGRYDPSGIDGAKTTATWILAGVIEALEDHFAEAAEEA